MKSILRESEKKIAKIICETKIRKESSVKKDALAENFLNETFSAFSPLQEEKNVAEKLKEMGVQIPFFASYYQIVNDASPLSWTLVEKKIKDNFLEFEFSLPKTKNISEKDLKQVLLKIETEDDKKNYEASHIFIHKMNMKRNPDFPNILAIDLKVAQRVINDKK